MVKTKNTTSVVNSAIREKFRIDLPFVVDLIGDLYTLNGRIIPKHKNELTKH